MTTEEYLQSPETVLPRELAYGELRVADSPSVSHQRVVLELMLALVPFVRQKQLGEVLIAPMDVILDFDNALVVQPDLLFVSNERRQIIGDRIYGAPDLVIEVVSPNTRIGRLEEHVGWFAPYGVSECWLVNTDQRNIAMLSLAQRPRPERGAKSPSESERGWGPASMQNAGVSARTLYKGAQPVASNVLKELRLTPLQIFGYDRS